MAAGFRDPHGCELRTVSVYNRVDRFHSEYFDRQIADRYLFELRDGNTIESAAYQHFFGDRPTTLAIDISSMVGCPMRCKFCASALIRYVRPLSVDEMTCQVVQLVKDHDNLAFPKLVCSFQGIGEPSLIPDRILESSRKLLCFEERVAISIATVGANLDALKEWRESGVPIDNLQISCSGTTNELLSWLMPGLPAIDRLVSETILSTRSATVSKVKFNYVLIKGYNDTDQDVQRLICFFRQTPVVVKISALNPTTTSERHALEPGTLERAQEICHELKTHGVKSFVYGSFNSTNVSCGQLTFSDEGVKQ